MKKTLLSKIISKHSDVFVRIGDKISEQFILENTHDYDVVETINYLAKSKGFSQVFVDIGANIGLISYQVGNIFQKIYCFEPNPEVLGVLHSNLYNLIRNNKLKIKPFALGSTRSHQELYIPIRNMGGAFIINAENTLSIQELSLKDNEQTIDSLMYRKVQITQVNTRTELKKIFWLERKKKKFLFKIDCEGMDAFILTELCKIVPKDVAVAVIFENHSPITLKKYQTKMIHLMHLYEIRTVNPYSKEDSNILKAFKVITGTTEIELVEVNVTENLRRANYLMLINEVGF